jgi:predicted Holliday junction resolvase-like endonuclease
MEILAIIIGLIAGLLGFFLYKNQIRLKNLQSEFNLLFQQNQNNIKFAQDCSVKHIGLTGKYQEVLRNSDKQNEQQNNKINELNDRINLLLENQDKNIKAARLDATSSQKSIVKGQINENLAVLLPCWKWKVSDSRFLGGAPLDFIIYNGLSEDAITDIILVDVKTGEAQLNTRQRQIKKVISEGKVSFETIRIE